MAMASACALWLADQGFEIETSGFLRGKSAVQRPQLLHSPENT
jgi:hypothetical protein